MEDPERNLFQALAHDIGRFPILTRQEETAIIERAGSGEGSARDQLIQSNLRFVVKMACSHWEPGLPLMDMIANGFMALLKATKTYDPAVGCRFISYAGVGIERSIWQTITTHRMHAHNSLDEVIYEGEDITRADLLESEQPPADALCLQGELSNLVERLTAREKAVLRERFWKDRSLAEVGSTLGITKERVRAIETRALLKLRWFINAKIDGGQRDD